MERLLISNDMPGHSPPNSKVLPHVRGENERTGQIWLLLEPHDSKTSLLMTVAQRDNQSKYGENVEPSNAPAPSSLGGTRPSSVYSSLEWLEIIQLFNSFPPCWDGVVWFLIGTRVFQLLWTLLVTLVMPVPQKPECLSFSGARPKQCTLKQPSAFVKADLPHNWEQNHDKSLPPSLAFCLLPRAIFAIES